MRIQLSKFLSYVLRHHPESIGLTLDREGWAFVDELLTKATSSGTPITRLTLLEIVHGNDKKRFTLSDDGSRIRAAQGHSVKVDLGHRASEPPPILFHGTAARFLGSIMADGLVPGSRQHVHLSRDRETAATVGRRHGTPTVLRVKAAAMVLAGHSFYLADNGVWLTDAVPPQYLETLD